MRRRTSLVSAVAAAALLAGCGLTDDAPKAGVAASVGEESVPLSRVDDVLQAYCSLLASTDGAPAYAKATIRSQLAWNWAQAVAVEKVADEYGATIPPDTIDPDEVRRMWGIDDEKGTDRYDSFAWLTWISQRLNEPVLTIGSQAVIDRTGQPGDQDAAAEAGFAVLDDWLEENGAELNPALGTYDPAKRTFSPDELSVAVSGAARQGDDLAALTPEQAAGLPDGQRCGAAVRPQAQPGA